MIYRVIIDPDRGIIHLIKALSNNGTAESYCGKTFEHCLKFVKHDSRRQVCSICKKRFEDDFKDILNSL